MAKRRIPGPRYDAETIRACAELLRCVDESRPLRSNAITTRIAPSTDVRDIVRFVNLALRDLTPRQRDIVVRCDVRGERYGVVAKALYVSERHVYRERRIALNHIAHRLLTELPANAAARPTVAPDAFDVRFALGAALDNAGNWQVAADILERLAADVALPEQRGAVEVRLAQLYRDADRFAQAYHHAGVARTLAARVAGGGELQRIEADLAVSGVAIASGDWQLADGLAQEAIALLRPSADESLGTRSHDALARALLLKAELLVDCGGVGVAFELASEALAVAGRSGADRSVEIGARAMVALTSILMTRDIAHAEAALWGCYRDALAGGFIRGSLIIASQLALHYRLAGRAADAVELLAPLVGTARVAGTGPVKSFVLEQLASASLMAGSLDTAAAYTAELSEGPEQNPLTRASVDLSWARIRLARRESAQALEAARAAETVYANIGLGRYVGLSLDVQARALSGLGDVESAQRTISRAVDVLTGTSHPRPLASAYYAMARITGERRYAVTARRLLRAAGAR
jgi:tetratricopeptide (TPR) repeat protein